MKIKNILTEILTEQVKDSDRGLFNKAFTKWREDVPNMSQEFGEFLFGQFTKYKGGLNLSNVNVKTFLNRFNGDINKLGKFAPQIRKEIDGVPNPRYNELIAAALRDIRNYNGNQIIFLINEFEELPAEYTGQQRRTREPIAAPNESPNERNIEASKNLWYTENEFTIISEGDFRVYSIPDRQTAIEFGYYQGYIAEKTSPYKNLEYHMQWCVGRHLISNNLWSNYRSSSVVGQNRPKRTFYYVIDESKHPNQERNTKNNIYFLGALQYVTDGGNSKYRLTPIANTGIDPIISEEDLLRIYPKLNGHLDKIKMVEYDASKETNADTDVINLINETEGNEYEFARQPKANKKEYIDRGKPIKKIKSWESIDDGMKKAYINITQRQNLYERFSFDLIEKIIEEPNIASSLRNRIQIIGGDDLGIIIRKMFKDSFSIVRKSIGHPYIHVYERNDDGLHGLFNINKLTWVRHNGVFYNPSFKIKDFSTIFDDSGSTYYVEKLVQEGTNLSFYLVSPLNTGNNIDTHIISQKVWEGIKDKFSDFNKYAIMSTDFQPEKHTDINEKKRV